MDYRLPAYAVEGGTYKITYLDNHRNLNKNLDCCDDNDKIIII